ncbi:hypothetical protein BDZ97DRAFT_1610392, partial [Flammula alnicola]
TFFLAALDYLPIQGSSVPCEHIFSSAKETMQDRRNHIHDTLMEELQMLKFSFNNGNTILDFGTGMWIQDILEFLEKSMDGPEYVP